MPYTKGFDKLRLYDHFDRHGRKLGATTIASYVAFADKFMGAPLARGVKQHIRQDGTVVRFDVDKDIFGVMYETGIIATFGKTMKPTRNLRLRYWRKECLK